MVARRAARYPAERPDHGRHPRRGAVTDEWRQTRTPPPVPRTTILRREPQGFIVKPFQAILSDAFTRAQQSFGPDIDLRSSSTIRKVIELGCLDAALFWMALDDVYHSGFTSTAAGDALDLLGADLGLAAGATRRQRPGDIQAGLATPPSCVLTLPPGTLVDTGRARPTPSPWRTVTLSNDPTQPYPGVGQRRGDRGMPGLSGNIAASSLTEINPTFAARYLSFDSWPHRREQHAGVQRRRGFEDDDDYRRSLQALPRTLWTADAIRAIVVGLDGVRDALVNDPYGGLDEPSPAYGAACFGDELFQIPRDVCSPYFFSIVVAPQPGVLWDTEGTPPTQILGLSDQILAALEAVRPISTFPTLLQADSVEVGVRAQITLIPGADADTVLAAARVAVDTYIGTLRLGDAVLYSQVLRVLTELTGVADVQNLHLRAARQSTARSCSARPPRSATRPTSPRSKRPPAAT